MVELKVQGENAASKAFIWEITIQCQMAMYIYERLAEYSRVQMERDFSAQKPRPRSAIELLSDCSAFLSACAVLAHCFFPAKKSSATRGKRLRELMGIDDLPALRALDVRNSFAHIDERLDLLLKEGPTDEIVQIHLARKAPTARHVLKRFDPATLTLSYLDKDASLESCASEIRAIRSAALELSKRKRSELSLLG